VARTTTGTADLFRLFDEFLELSFENGRLVEAADRSGAVRRISEKLGDGRVAPTEDLLAAWLKEEFRQNGYVDYNQSLY